MDSYNNLTNMEKLTGPIDQAYPKVKPLALALISAAAEQEATVEEFQMACARVERMLSRRVSRILLSELQGE